MAEIERYRVVCEDYISGDENGDYVLYDDIKHLIDHQRPQLVVTDEMVMRYHYATRHDTWPWYFSPPADYLAKIKLGLEAVLEQGG